VYVLDLTTGSWSLWVVEMVYLIFKL